MKRRARNEGNIRKRDDGRYEPRVVDPDTGRRRSLFAKTEAEALAKLTAARRDIDNGVGLGDARLTLETYLENWLVGVRPTVRPTTYERYESLMRCHVVPVIGKVRLRSVTPAHLRKLYADLQQERTARQRPGRKGRAPRGLGARTVGHIHRVLHAALKQAARDGLAVRNVSDLVSPPKVPHVERMTLDGEQVRRLLDAAKGSRDSALYVLTVTTGMRLGEVLGLRWADIDLDGAALHVRRSLAKVQKGVPLYQKKGGQDRPFTPRCDALTRRSGQSATASSQADRGTAQGDRLGRQRPRVP